MANQIYNDAFYKDRNEDTKYSAERVMDVLFKRLYKMPKSMVDIGCGIGTWLGTANSKYGVETVVGLDGDYVPRQYLQINKDSFIPCNLEDYQAEKVLQKIQIENLIWRFHLRSLNIFKERMQENLLRICVS